jgi:hypothetical protein
MQKQRMPAVQPPTRMPLPDDAQAKAAKKRAQAALAASGGRESTDLTDTDMTSNLGV